MTPIHGYEKYHITPAGEVYNTVTGRMLKPFQNERGYNMISVCANGKKRTLKIHRLVALHFIPPVDGKLQVNHKDGNKQNNHVDNLEWCTNAENNKHAYDIGLKTPNIDHLKVPVLHQGMRFESIQEFITHQRVDRNEYRRMLAQGKVTLA